MQAYDMPNYCTMPFYWPQSMAKMEGAKRKEDLLAAERKWHSVHAETGIVVRD